MYSQLKIGLPCLQGIKAAMLQPHMSESLGPVQNELQTAVTQQAYNVRTAEPAANLMKSREICLSSEMLAVRQHLSATQHDQPLGCRAMLIAFDCMPYYTCFFKSEKLMPGLLGFKRRPAMHDLLAGRTASARKCSHTELPCLNMLVVLGTCTQDTCLAFETLPHLIARLLLNII